MGSRSVCAFLSGVVFGGVRVCCLCVRCFMCPVCLPLRVCPRVCPVPVLRFEGIDAACPKPEKA